MRHVLLLVVALLALCGCVMPMSPAYLESAHEPADAPITPHSIETAMRGKPERPYFYVVTSQSKLRDGRLQIRANVSGSAPCWKVQLTVYTGESTFYGSDDPTTPPGIGLFFDDGFVDRWQVLEGTFDVECDGNVILVTMEVDTLRPEWTPSAAWSLVLLASDGWSQAHTFGEVTSR